MSEEFSASIQTVEQKLNIAKQKKETADQAFKLGNVKDGEFSFIAVSKTKATTLHEQLLGRTTR